MFIATLLKPRPLANINSGSSSPARQSKMLQRRASRHRRSSFPATQPVEADFMKPPDEEIFPVAPAITIIDVVDVEPELPPRPEIIQLADVGPAVDVDSTIATPEESVVVAPDMVPTIADATPIEVVPTLASAAEITATLPSNAATAEPTVQVVPGIITAVPSIASAAIVPADAIPATTKKAKKPRRKRENVGLGCGAVKTKRPRKKSAKGLGVSGAADLTVGDGWLPGYELCDTSGAHSPP